MMRIPPQLKKQSYRFVKCRGKRPFEKKWENEKNYSWREIEKYDGNYGLINKSGSLIVIDADCENISKIIKKSLPKTFVVKSHNEHRHFYYKCENCTIGKKLFKNSMGDVRGYSGHNSNYITICPPSIHPDTGEPYEVVENNPIAEISERDILEKLDNFFISNRKKSNKLSLKKPKKGDRNNTFFKTACRLRNTLDYEEVLEIIKLRNNDLKEPLKISEAESLVKSAYSYKNEKENGLSGINIEKVEFEMKNKRLLDKVIKEIQNEGIVGEETPIKVLILKICLRLALGTAPTSSNIFISDSTGLGKDNLVKNVCNVLLEPEKTYFHRTDLSDKVLNYWITPDNKPDSTWNGTVIHFEDPRPNVIQSQAFKVRASGDNRITVLKDQKVINRIIKGKPVMIVTSANASINEECGRRWDAIRLDDSEEQTKKIINRILKDDKKEANMVLRYGLKSLEPFEVKIPFTDLLKNILPTTVVMRTQIHKLKDYIKASAVLHQHQREMDDNGRLIATWDDYDYAAFVFNELKDIEGDFKNKDEEEFFNMLSKEKEGMTIKEASVKFEKRDIKWIYNHKYNWKKRSLLKETIEKDANTFRDVTVIHSIDNVNSNKLPTAEEIKKIRCNEKS
jgi:hypothetical protein